jgi:tetratricopeptide (TPR) repeat protein
VPSCAASQINLDFSNVDSWLAGTRDTPIRGHAIISGAMKKTALVAVSLFISALCLAQNQNQQQSVSQQGPPQPEFVRQANQLARDGKLADALKILEEHTGVAADAFAANIGAGNVLDLMDKGEEARKHFAKAVEIAPTPQQKEQANRATAMSWAFEGNCRKTLEYEQKVIDFYKGEQNFFQQGEVADEGARVCIDNGDLNAAEEWYKMGHDLGMKEPGIKPDRVDLWNFRWEHAQARIAARRGNKAEAEKHVAAAKAILDKGTNPTQVQFFPYLVGYVALYAGDYKTALENLEKANQNDPFIQCLMAETYEKSGDKAKAAELYKKASATTAHNPPGAYAHRATRPVDGAN